MAANESRCKRKLGRHLILHPSPPPQQRLGFPKGKPLWQRERERDNECEYLADFISSYKEWFKYLIERCIDSIYTTAKWQLVKRLPVYKDDSSVTDWVFKYINVDDEYTQRMSLSALSEIDYKKAEQYAIEFWERDKYKGDTYAEEYQKIMALSVLYKIKSDKLSEYIEAARQLDFVYLKENADEIANSGLIQ